jgi:hypothetical protein
MSAYPLGRRCSASFDIGDTVRTPSERLATVKGFSSGRVLCVYVDSDRPNDEVPLLARLLTLVRKQGG